MTTSRKERVEKGKKSIVAVLAAYAAFLLLSSSLLPIIIIMPASLLMTTTQAAAYAQVASESSNGCNCIVVRLDDIQTEWVQGVQVTLLDRLIDEQVSTTLGLIMNEYGTGEPHVRDKVNEGVDLGLFELAIHAWEHVPHNTLPLEVQSETMAQAQDRFAEITSVASARVLITPFNVFNEDTLAAMQTNGFDIISSNPNTLEKSPNAPDRYGVIHLHQSIDYGYLDRATGQYTWRGNSEILDAINRSMVQRGYAVFTIHPQDFATYDVSSGDRLDIPDHERIDNFISLIEQLRDVDGHKLVHFEDAAELLEGVELPDGVRPSVSITSQSSASFVAQLGVPFTVEGTATDNEQVASVEVRVTNAENTDGTYYEPAITSDDFGHWSYELTIPKTEYNVIRVRVTDTSGNQQWSSLPLNFEGMIINGIPSPDTIAPSATIISPGPGAKITTGEPFIVTGTAIDNDAVASVEVRVTNAENTDGTNYELASDTSDGFATWDLEFTISDAEHNVLRVRVTDTAGNQEEVSININVIGRDIIDDDDNNNNPPTSTPPTRTITSQELVDEIQLGENLAVEKFVATADEDDSPVLPLILTGGIAGVIIIIFFVALRVKLIQQ